MNFSLPESDELNDLITAPVDTTKQAQVARCVCNATLRSEWKLRGIGPICAEKFGW